MSAITVDIKSFLLSHAIWVAAAIVGFVGFHAWIGEHDARLASEAQVKVSETAIANLQQHIAQTDAAAVQKVQVVTKIVHDVATPAQAIATIPQLTDMPLNARVAPDNPTQIAVDAVPFVQLLGQFKTDAINLATCQSDLKDQTAIVAQKQDEIAALKKKPSFFNRVKGTAKAVGVGIGIGILLAAHGV